MKKLLLTSIAALFLPTGTAQAQTHDADFPDQMKAIDACYVAYIVRALWQSHRLALAKTSPRYPLPSLASYLAMQRHPRDRHVTPTGGNRI